MHGATSGCIPSGGKQEQVGGEETEQEPKPSNGQQHGQNRSEEEATTEETEKKRLRSSQEDERQNQSQQGTRRSIDNLNIPEIEEGVRFQAREKQHIKGRGTIDTSMRHPIIYAEPIRKWFNMLVWNARDPEQRPNSPCETITHLECLVELEMATGIKFGNEGHEPMSWAERARILAYYIKT